MPRGDELNEELRFSDRDDESEDLGGFGGGGSSFDDDEEDESGWGMSTGSDNLWDSAEEEVDEEDEDVETDPTTSTSSE